jgi:hypothetical protein
MFHQPADSVAYVQDLLPFLQVTHWFDRRIAGNPEQHAAVQSIVAGTSGRLPYIIWGHLAQARPAHWWRLQHR